jgi:hypothetical protein
MLHDEQWPQINLEVALNYKTSNFAKNSITPMIQPLFPIPEIINSHPQEIVLFSAGLYLPLTQKEAGHE